MDAVGEGRKSGGGEEGGKDGRFMYDQWLHAHTFFLLFFFFSSSSISPFPLPSHIPGNFCLYIYSHHLHANEAGRQARGQDALNRKQYSNPRPPLLTDGAKSHQETATVYRLDERLNINVGTEAQDNAPPLRDAPTTSRKTMPTASARLAIQTTLFTLAALLHIARSLLDLRQRVVSRASTFWASIGLFFYAATFALDRYRDVSGGAIVSARFMAPTGLWAFKVSVASLYPQLGLRLLVVGVLGGYLAASYFSAVLMQLFVCRPWEEWDVEYCGDTTGVAAYSALNVSSYIVGNTARLLWRAPGYD